MAEDPAEDRIQQTIRLNFAKVAAAERTGSTEEVQIHMAAATREIHEGIKEYMSSSGRFAARMQASLGYDSKQDEIIGLSADEEDPNLIKTRVNLTETARDSEIIKDFD